MVNDYVSLIIEKYLRMQQVINQNQVFQRIII